MKEKLKSLTIDKYLTLILFVALFIIPLISSLYGVQMVGKIISFMIFALALDILWGYGGLMNLGFAVFFGIGGYVIGISLACQDGIPAFMSSLGKLPWFYVPLQNLGLAFVLGLVNNPIPIPCRIIAITIR